MFKRFIASLALVATFIPSFASASGYLVTGDGHRVTGGFCTSASDGTTGVMPTGESYKSWLEVFALDLRVLDTRVEVTNIERMRNGLEPMTEAEEKAYRVKELATSANLIRSILSTGQANICPFVR